MEVSLFKDGILRVIMDENTGMNKNRFRLTEHDEGAAVSEDQLERIDIFQIV